MANIFTHVITVLNSFSGYTDSKLVIKYDCTEPVSRTISPTCLLYKISGSMDLHLPLLHLCSSRQCSHSRQQYHTHYQ